jgi:microsomal dipeptidase-like Zn-dependent dipeptidase
MAKKKVAGMDRKGLDISMLSPAPRNSNDALTHDPRALRYLIDLVGADRVVIGTDAPFDMGEEHPVEMIAKVKGLSAKDRDQVFGKRQ